MDPVVARGRVFFLRDAFNKDLSWANDRQRYFVYKLYALTRLVKCTEENNSKFDRLISDYSEYEDLVALVKWEQEEYRKRLCSEQVVSEDVQIDKN